MCGCAVTGFDDEIGDDFVEDADCFGEGRGGRPFGGGWVGVVGCWMGEGEVMVGGGKVSFGWRRRRGRGCCGGVGVGGCSVLGRDWVGEVGMGWTTVGEEQG